MIQLKKTILGGVLAVATLALLLGAVADVGSLISFGGTLTSNVVANVIVQKACYISLSNTVVNFGSIPAGSNGITSNAITDNDLGGDAVATILIAGGTGGSTFWYQTGNWLGTSAANTIGVANTLYSGSSQVTYTGTAVTNTLTSTGLTVAAPTQSSPSASTTVYLGMGIPGGTLADTYTTNIVIENSC
jgi:hypothetical protein